MGWVIAYGAASAGLCWFVHRTYARGEAGPRRRVAAGCTVLAFVTALLGGLYLLVPTAIGGSFGL